jgi:uncharacterized protein (TIGR02145 family)
VSPDPTSPGEIITITGTNFYAGGSTSGVLRVTIGGERCTNRTVISNTSLTCAVPELIPDTYPVVVTTFGGVSNSDVEVEIINPPPIMQEIVSINDCPVSRTWAIDARDNHTYWIQRIPNAGGVGVDFCWMLTNLAYGGGGDNAYGDVKNISESTVANYTQPFYSVPSGSNVTTYPAIPSDSTTGIGQYGYLYNWCAAMGYQAGTSACLNAGTPLPNQNISICPAGWRLPIGSMVNDDPANEFIMLNNAVNGGSTDDTGLRTVWLAMRAGQLVAGTGFNLVGQYGDYWSSTQHSSIVRAARAARLSGDSNPVTANVNQDKIYGLAVRCLIAPLFFTSMGP